MVVVDERNEESEQEHESRYLYPRLACSPRIFRAVHLEEGASQLPSKHSQPLRLPPLYHRLSWQEAPTAIKAFRQSCRREVAQLVGTPGNKGRLPARGRT